MKIEAGQTLKKWKHIKRALEEGWIIQSRITLYYFKWVDGIEFVKTENHKRWVEINRWTKKHWKQADKPEFKVIEHQK